ncbi:MAG: AAA family ATPase, partial [Phycisphaerae bacterium]
PTADRRPPTSPTADRRLPTRLVRLDMSEYAGPDAADRFLGTAHGGPPDWIQRVRHQPFCVLLLDEIEKAAPEIFDLLLGVFDEGRLTDPWGRLTWFRSAVIVMTSNLGAGRPTAFGLSRAGAAPPAMYDADAMGFFRPEFFNRIDAVVTFDPLTEPTVRAITAKELGDIAAREGLDKRGIKLAWTDRLVASLAAVGFDPRYGARPLQRTIEQRVVTPLARYVVDHPEVTSKTLTLDLGEGGVATVS